MAIPVLFLVLLLALPTHQSSDLITNSCEQTLFKDYCKSTLGSAPASEAKDLTSLAKFVLKKTTSKGAEIQKKISSLPATDEFTKQCLTDCSQNYQDALERLKDSATAVNSKSYNDFNTWVGAAMTSARSCEDGFHEKDGIKSPLTAENTEFNQLCSITLTLSNLLAKA